MTKTLQVTQLPPIERKTIVSCQGRARELVRYQGQRRWYAGLHNAQFALNREANDRRLGLKGPRS